MRALPLILSTAAALVLARPILAFLQENAHVRENYRGVRIPCPLGLLIPAAALVAIAVSAMLSGLLVARLPLLLALPPWANLGMALFSAGLLRAMFQVLATPESAVSMAARRDFTAARRHFVSELRRASPRIEDRWFPWLVALGLAFNSQKLYTEAQAPLARSLEIEPDNLEGLAALGEAEEGTGELAAAETHAARVLAREADHAVGNLVMGLVRMKQERYADARGFLERAIASDPLSGKAHYQLSLACARLADDACQREQLELYQSAQRQQAENLAKLRGAIGAQKGGMTP